MEANSERWHQAAAERKYHSSSRERVVSMGGRCVRTAGAFCSLLQTSPSASTSRIQLREEFFQHTSHFQFESNRPYFPSIQVCPLKKCYLTFSFGHRTQM